MRKYSQDLKAASLRRKQRRETAKAVKDAHGAVVQHKAKAEASVKAYERARRRAEGAEQALKAAGTLDGRRLKESATEQLASALAQQIAPQVLENLTPYVWRVCSELASQIITFGDLGARISYDLDEHVDPPVLRGCLQLDLDTWVHQKHWDDIPAGGKLLRRG